MQQSGGNTLHAPPMKTCFYLSLSTVWFHHMAVIPPLSSAGTKCRTNGSLFIHTPPCFCPVMLFALSVISEWSNFLWNNALSARFNNTFLPKCNLWWAYVNPYGVRALRQIMEFQNDRKPSSKLRCLLLDLSHMVQHPSAFPKPNMRCDVVLSVQL